MLTSKHGAIYLYMHEGSSRQKKDGKLSSRWNRRDFAVEPKLTATTGANLIDVNGTGNLAHISSHLHYHSIPHPAILVWCSARQSFVCGCIAQLDSSARMHSSHALLKARHLCIQRHLKVSGHQSNRKRSQSNVNIRRSSYCLVGGVKSSPIASVGST